MFSSFVHSVVSEGAESSLFQSVVEVIGEVHASVYASETQVHVVLIVVGGLVGRRREGFGKSCSGSHGNLEIGEE